MPFLKLEIMKTFEAIYKKEFEAETEDAVYIANLLKPEKYKLINVQEKTEEKSLFDNLGKIFNPKNK